MTPERWQNVKDVLCAVLALEPERRSAYLDSACGIDASLRRAVETLLDLEEDARSGFLESPPVIGSPTSEGTADEHGPHETVPGTVLGHYHLLQKVGEGGMGEVWLAEQREPVRRRVALKLVKGGTYTREVMARFESERQALALMDHPAIAKVFDAGSTPQGAPYFVMEYVAGVPITAYCDNHRLSTRERLELFVHVCEGVQHAHQKAIIHRDLKPSNILVTEVDGRAAPKIIDFGVAKALAQRLTEQTMYTRVGSLVGTPEYMSPEQALSAGEDIDTRTDVYSLGVIFYELLAGAPPLELRKVALDEFLRRLREQEPPTPSTKIRTQDHATSAELARKRQTEPLALTKQIRGDLDSIALKALEKDRSRRYSSPADFAADIGRYLRNEAVLAVAPSVAYRTRKFARRHRAALVTACAFALVLIAAAVVSIRQSIRANQEAAVSQAVNDFLQNDLLSQASAYNQSKPDPDLKVRTALDQAAARIGGKFDRQPEVEAAIRDTIGQTYMDLGLSPEARTQFERALDLQRRVLGAKNPQTLKTMSRLGRIAGLQGKVPEAEMLDSQSVAIQRRVLGPEHPDTLYSMNNLASIYMDERKYAQAEALHRQVLEIKRRVLGPEHPDTLRSMNNLANVYFAQRKYAQAEPLYERTIEIKQRVLGPEHPDTLRSMSNLANIYYYQGKYAQAEALYGQTLEIRRRVLGPEHPETLGNANVLGEIYYLEGEYAQAEALFSRVLEIQRHVLGPEDPGTLASMGDLAEAYGSQGKFAQAEALAIQTLEIRRRERGLEHRDTLMSMNSLAEFYGDQAKYGQAEALLDQTLEMAKRVLGSENPDTLSFLSNSAFMYQREGKYAVAETYATQTLAGRRHALGSEHPDTMASAADLALAFLSQGKFTDAEPLAREAMEADQKQRPDDWQRFRAESLVGANLAGEKKYGEAEPLLLEGYQGMLARKDRIDVPSRYHLDLAHRWVVQLYQAWGKPEKAAEWKKK
jgi:eukaryotic-like serine/threonine-protein kinase